MKIKFQFESAKGFVDSLISEFPDDLSANDIQLELEEWAYKIAIFNGIERYKYWANKIN
jgi:hypothetical protein